MSKNKTKLDDFEPQVRMFQEDAPEVQDRQSAPVISSMDDIESSDDWDDGLKMFQD